MVVTACIISVGLIHGNGRLNHISRTSTGPLVDCVVSVDWYWNIGGPILSVRLILGQ